jgi:uncharacterized repeat protein (TIGR01451 family)
MLYEETTDPSAIGVSRRDVLAAVTAGGALALAGCPGDGDTSCDATLQKNVDGEFAYGGQGTYVFDICTPSGTTGDGGQECDGTFTVEDDLPDGITFDSVSGDWTASTSGGVVTAELSGSDYGTISDGDCLTLEMDVSVGSPGDFQGEPPHTVENCADLRYEGNLEDDACVRHDIVRVGGCDLSLTKDTGGEFIFGQEGTYTYEVCNEGGEECTGALEVNDDLPMGVSFDSVSGDWMANTSGGVVTATNDTYGGLAAGACLTFEMTVSVAPPGEGPDAVENCASLIHDEDVVAEDCVEHPLSHADCDLSITKSVDDEFHHGQEGTYVLEICNEAEEECTGPLTIEDDLPEGTTFESISGSWVASASGGEVTATLDSHGGIAPGSCLTVELTVDVAALDDFPDDVDELENCAALSHDGESVGEDCVTHPVTSDPCELSFSKEVGAFGGFHFGGLGTYVFEICNEGETPCDGPLTIEDDLPDGLSFASLGGGWSVDISGGTVTATNDSHDGIAPGECLVVEMTVDVAPAGEFDGDTVVIENCAELGYSGAPMTEDCVEHRITPGEGCPPAEFVLNTGYDQSAAGTLPGGDGDAEWQIVTDTAGSGPVPRDATVVDGSVVDNNWDTAFPSSRWIAHQEDAAIDSSHPTFEYQYCFCLHENFADPELAVTIFADDTVTDILLNGTPLAYSGDGSVSLGNTPIEETYTDPGLFQAGDNCLTVVVQDTIDVVAGLDVVGRMRAESADCDCEVPEPDCDRSFSKDVAGEFHYGQQGTYVYEVCNDGDTTCTGTFMIEDDLPEGFTFATVDVAPTPGDCCWMVSPSGPGDSFVATHDDHNGLDPGECLTLEVTVDVPTLDAFDGDPPHEIENCAVLSHDGAEVTEDCVTHPVTQSGECELTLEKSTTGEFVYGEEYQAGYVYEVCNEGDQECTGELGITDPLPDGISGPVNLGAGMTGPVNNGVFEGTIQYNGLAPGECLTREMFVVVENADAFPGDPPNEIRNCAGLVHDGTVVDEDCTTHDVTTGEDPCPPVDIDLNSGYDQETDTTLGDGVDDDDWQIVTDTTDSGAVPRPATVVDAGTVSQYWPSPLQDSRWIAHQADADVAFDASDDTIAYEYCFCLNDGFRDPELTLGILADDAVTDIQLNGTSLPFSGDGSVSVGNPPIGETYTDPDLFQAGDNCLEITVEDTANVVSGLDVTGTITAQNADCDCDPGCDLSLEKSTTGEFVYGEERQAGYVYEVCNEGDQECTEELGITDPLPDGISGPVELGAGMTGPVNSGVFEGTIQYGGLAPGECFTREMFVVVENADAFPGDPPNEVENCAELRQNGTAVDEDCTTHDVTSG